MHTISLLLLSVFLSCPAVPGQTTPTDSNTLRAILDEVHKLRQDLQATSATVQRVQILLHRLRIQADVVAQASGAPGGSKSDIGPNEIQPGATGQL